MLNWLDNFWRNVTGSVGQAVSTAAHWAEHALASVVFAVFGLVGKAWLLFLKAVADLGGSIRGLALEVYTFAVYVVRVLVPRVVKWAEAQLAKLSAMLALVYHDFLAFADWTKARFVQAYHDIETWVLVHVWAPLKAYADQIWADLKKWGYTAWWYITHLDALAEAMIYHIALSLEKHAWELASMLGKFFLSLVIANLKPFLLLIEDIITAVL